jgi:hypothetical protein
MVQSASSAGVIGTVVVSSSSSSIVAIINEVESEEQWQIVGVAFFGSRKGCLELLVMTTHCSQLPVLSHFITPSLVSVAQLRIEVPTTTTVTHHNTHRPHLGTCYHTNTPATHIPFRLVPCD